MAFVATNLRKLAEGLFVYNATADSAATATGSGYFNSVTTQLKLGDIIFLISTSNAAIDVIFIDSATKAATVTTIAVEGVA